MTNKTLKFINNFFFDFNKKMRERKKSMSISSWVMYDDDDVS